ncbi:MAG: hypothetical protein AAF194_01190 [Pseudomonadota bacterium]
MQTGRLNDVEDAAARSDAAFASGDAFQERAAISGRNALLREADRIYQTGLAGLPPDCRDERCRRLISHRADALQRLAMVLNDREALEESIALGSHVLEIVPESDRCRGILWSNRASGLTKYAHITGDQRHLDKAIADFRKTAELLLEGEGNHTYARIGLAQALRQAGHTRHASDVLRAAIAVFEKVIDFSTALPDTDLAMTQNGRGIARFRLGEMEGDGALLTSASGDHEIAEKIYARSGPKSDLVKTLFNIGNVAVRSFEIVGTLSDRHRAAASYARARALITPEEAPLDWATLHPAIGNVIIQRGLKEGRINLLLEAREALEIGAAIFSPERTPGEWAGRQINLAIADQLIAAFSGSPAGSSKPAHLRSPALFGP